MSKKRRSAHVHRSQTQYRHRTSPPSADRTGFHARGRGIRRRPPTLHTRLRRCPPRRGRPSGRRQRHSDGPDHRAGDRCRARHPQWRAQRRRTQHHRWRDRDRSEEPQVPRDRHRVQDRMGRLRSHRRRIQQRDQRRRASHRARRHRIGGTGRNHPRRRNRVPRAKARHDHRLATCRRGGHGGRRGGARRRGVSSRPLLGHQGRWRQFRGRHQIPSFDYRSWTGSSAG